MAAGATNNLTIVAEDTYGNTVTTYSGSKSLVFAGANASPNGTLPTVTNSSGTSINFGSATAINFTSGQATVSGSSNGVMRLYKAETANIVVTQGLISNSSNPLQVIVSSTGTATQFSLVAATTTPTAGAADNLTITAEDIYGNTVTSFTGSKSLTFGGANAIGSNNPTVTNASASPTNFGTAESFSFASGVASSTTAGASGQAVMTLYQTGTDSVVVSAGSINNGSGLSVTVGSPGASQLVFGQQPSDAYVGLSMSPAVTVQIEDRYGNLISSTSSITLTVTTNPCGGTPIATNGTVSALSGTATFSSLQISKECIGYALTATDSTDGGITVVSNTFTVSALVTASANLLQDTATDAGGSGMNSVTYYRCSGFTTSCASGTPWTTIGSSTTAPSYQLNWASLPASGSYSIVAVGTDIATNSTTSTPPIPVTVDGTGPTGGAISVPTYVNTLSVTITTTNFTDSVSGMASNVIDRSNAQSPLGGVCPPGGYTGATPVTSPDTGVTNGKCYEYSLTGTANDGTSTSVTSSPVFVDTVAPMTTIAVSPSSSNGSNGWYKGTSPTFTLSATDTAGSGVAATYYEVDGGPQTPYLGSAVTIPDGSAQTISYWSIDNAGNTETTNTTAALKIDTVAPMTTNALSPISPNGSNGWYDGTSPTFTLSATDAGGSGVATIFYEIDGGTQTAYPGSAVTIPNGSTQTISYWSVDTAGNTETTHTTATLKIDTLAPSGGAVTVNGVAASTLGSTSSSTTASFAITSRTDYTDAGSGLASSTLAVQSETLTGTTCGAPGSGGPFTSPTTVTGTSQPSGITTGFCYLYTLTGTDMAGNTAAVSTRVTVSSSGPVQQDDYSSSSPVSTFTIASSSNFTVGDTLVFLLAYSGSDYIGHSCGGSITDSQGNTWVAQTQRTSTLSAGANADEEIWSTTAKTGADTVTVDLPVGNPCAATEVVQYASVTEWAGIISPTADTHAGGNATTGTTVAPSAITPSLAGDVIIAIAFANAGNSNTVPSGFTALTGQTNQAYAVYEVDPNTNPVQPSWTEPSGGWAAGIAAFKT
jgi:hypothetical protein